MRCLKQGLHRCHERRLRRRSRAHASERGNEARQDLVDVSDDTEIGGREYGCCRVAINCDDVLGVLHAYKVMDRQPLPIVAWLNGAAVGAGAILALLSDLRLVHDGARLSIPAAVYGYPLSDGLVRRLSYELGQPMARYVLFGGGELLANQLLALGIAQFSAQTLDEALEHALAMAQYAPGSIRELRRSLQNSRAADCSPGKRVSERTTSPS